MGVYDPVEIGDWTAEDVARNIVNAVLDQVPILEGPEGVAFRQGINDTCDRFVTGLLERWTKARFVNP